MSEYVEADHATIVNTWDEPTGVFLLHISNPHEDTAVTFTGTREEILTLLRRAMVEVQFAVADTLSQRTARAVNGAAQGSASPWPSIGNGSTL